MTAAPTRRDALNAAFDALARPTISWRGRRLPAFTFLGALGFLLGTLLGVALAAATGLSPRVVLLLSAAAAATFLALAMATKVLTGAERLVYYRHEIAILATATLLLLRGLGEPVLPYVDVTVLGVGVFLAFGRAGCFRVGCCHGRPHRVGVRYGPEHAAEGLHPALVGRRLFPVQAIESIVVLLVTGAGAALVVLGAPPGTAFAWYLTAYGVARFALEETRGDDGRPTLAGVTEAQWISLASAAAVAWAGHVALLPAGPAHMIAAAGIALAATARVARHASRMRRTRQAPRPHTGGGGP